MTVFGGETRSASADGGLIVMSSGRATGKGVGGSMTVVSGSSVSSGSGSVVLASGDVASAGDSGSMILSTGKSAKGGGTRKPRKPSSAAILRRRKSRRYGQLKLR